MVQLKKKVQHFSNLLTEWPLNSIIHTWYKKDDYEVDMVGHPAHGEQNHNYEAHLDNLLLLLDSLSNGWLGILVVCHLKQLISTDPQFQANDSVAVA